MGDRALVIFKHGEEFSPTIYLHWMGSDVPDLLAEHRAFMGDSADDLDYTAARFVGLCASKTSGDKTGIGIFNTDAATLTDDESLKAASHGDAGVILVSLPSFEWKAYGGYLAKVAA